MFAVVITRPGGPEVLELREVPQPQPGPDEVLVRVRASALNRADLLQRQGRYPAPPGVPPDIPGMEFAGEVAALGENVCEWQPGDRVFGLVAGGAHAEYLLAHRQTLARIPEQFDWTAAGAIPEAFITAHDALVTQAGLQPGERVLIHAVASGVGLAATQLVRALEAHPYGTTRTAEKLERTRPFGLTDGAAIRDPATELAPMAERWTEGRGFNIVLDLVGGPYCAPSIAALALKGRILLVGTVAGGRAELDLRQVMGKRLRIMGTVLRARPLEEKIAVMAAFSRDVLPLVAQGKVQPVIDSVFPIAGIREAHERLESNATFGKVALIF